MEELLSQKLWVDEFCRATGRCVAAAPTCRSAPSRRTQAPSPSMEIFVSDGKPTTHNMVKISSAWRATARRMDTGKRRAANVPDKEDVLTDGLLRRGKVSLATQGIYRKQATKLASKHSVAQSSTKAEVD